MGTRQLTPTQQRIIEVVREVRAEHRACTAGEVARRMKNHRSHIADNVIVMAKAGILSYSREVVGSIAIVGEQDTPRPKLIVSIDPAHPVGVIVCEQLEHGELRVLGPKEYTVVREADEDLPPPAKAPAAKKAAKTPQKIGKAPAKKTGAVTKKK